MGNRDYFLNKPYGVGWLNKPLILSQDLSPDAGLMNR